MEIDTLTITLTADNSNTIYERRGSCVLPDVILKHRP